MYLFSLLEELFYADPAFQVRYHKNTQLFFTHLGKNHDKKQPL